MTWDRTKEESVLRIQIGGALYLRAECYRRTKPARWVWGAAITGGRDTWILLKGEAPVGGSRGRAKAEAAAANALRAFAAKVTAAVEG